MGNYIKYQASMSFVDEYLIPTANAENEEGTSLIIPGKTRYRHHTSMNMAKGGSGTHSCTLASATSSDVVVDTTAGGVTLGTFTSIKGICIKHSGYQDAAKEIVSVNTLYIYRHQGSEQVLVAHITPNSALVLPYYDTHTPVLFGKAGGNTVCVEIAHSR